MDKFKTEIKRHVTNTKMNMRTEYFDREMQSGNFCDYSNYGAYSF